MLGWFRTRDTVSAAVIFFYLIPLLAFVGYNMWLSTGHSFSIFSFGLLILVVGTVGLNVTLAGFERHLRQRHRPEEKKNSETETFSNEEISLKNAEIQSLIEAQDNYVNESKESLDHLAEENQTLLNQITHKETLLERAEMTIAELRATQDRKQQRINQLESKVRDLSYEIKTLLQLTEIPDATTDEKPPAPSVEETTKRYSVEPKPKPQPTQNQQNDATSQLKRCIDIAQKMTGASHYSSSNSRFRGLPVDNFALDLRCLFDSLRSENNSTVLFYSPKEHKLLFANDLTRKLTGWSPEKFVQNFEHIVQEGKDEWEKAIKQLSSQSEAKVRLILKSRSGEDTLVHGLLGTIPTGIFRHHVIVILYNVDHRHALSSNI